MKYKDEYQHSIKDKESFWGEQGKRIDWIRPYSKVKNTLFSDSKVDIRWYEDGTLNACANCIDRHLEKRGDKIALLWEGDEPSNDKKVTYKELYEAVCRFANVLKKEGVKKGDRVTIYMPMIIEAAYAMLACARIGAVHSVVFGGFSAEALAGRIEDCRSDFVISADEGIRGGKKIPLKKNLDKALEQAKNVRRVLLVQNSGAEIEMRDGRDIWLHEALKGVEAHCPPEEMSAEDPLFILYTSGSTGTPKGVLHSTGGYMVYVSLTHSRVFDYQESDIYWCTADIGWVTGHSYMIYGPLANGATTLLFEGVPNYPDAGRFWQVCDKYGVSIFYTAPTALRALMGAGDKWVKKHSRKSLRILGTVGEPINPEAWKWYYEIVGNKNCPIMDTWWQTETGGHMITPLPELTNIKAGAAMKPFFGIEAVLLNEKQQELEGEASGALCIKDSWPGQMRSVYGDHQRFIDTYFRQYPGYYFSGDGAYRDSEGDIWISGRMDDVLNVSGHRMGTAEIESALVAHSKVAEAAIVGYPHAIKGESIHAYVTLMAGEAADEETRQALRSWVGEKIGAIAKPEKLQFAPALPKTRSGKIMRRILRKIAANEYEALGDISTLADPQVVADIIIAHRKLG